MFSERSKLEDTPNALFHEFSARRAAGLEILDLTRSNPTQVGLDYPAQALLSQLAQPGTLRYEPEPFGLWSARRALRAELYPQVTEAELLLTASTSEAYAYAFKLFCDAGDNVLCPTPSYPLFEHLARFEHVELRRYPLRYDGAWHIDLDALSALRDARTRAVVVVNPNNPTGSYLSHEELSALERLGLPIVGDEVFWEYPLAGKRPARACSTLEAKNVLTLTFGGLSKLAALPQLKLAWTALGGPSQSVAEARARLEFIADSFLSPSTQVQLALPALLRESARIRRELQQRIDHNWRTLREKLLGSALSMLHLEGGWYATLSLPRTLSEDAWVMKLLREAGVWVQPGYFYDFPSEAHSILSLITEPREFARGIERISKLIARELAHSCLEHQSV